MTASLAAGVLAEIAGTALVVASWHGAIPRARVRDRCCPASELSAGLAPPAAIGLASTPAAAASARLIDGSGHETLAPAIARTIGDE